MKKQILTALLGALLLASPARADDAAALKMSTLDITATAEVKAAPDIAEMSAGVVTGGPDAAQALNENTQKMNKLFKVLKDAGIADKDIRTSGINISPEYEYRQNKTPRISAYQVSNTVSVILRDLKNIGPVLDALVAEGSNQVNGPNFSVDNPDVMLDKARQEAVTKARKRADLYAAAAGMKIKRIMSISEQTSYSPVIRPMMMKAMAMDAGAAPTPVAAGESSLSATVNIRFELE